MLSEMKALQPQYAKWQVKEIGVRPFYGRGENVDCSFLTGHVEVSAPHEERSVDSPN